MSDPSEDWLIVFRPLPGPVPVAVRMRALLKRALRDWGLKAVVVRDAKEGNDDGQTKEATTIVHSDKGSRGAAPV